MLLWPFYQAMDFRKNVSYKNVGSLVLYILGGRIEYNVVSLFLYEFRLFSPLI